MSSSSLDLYSTNQGVKAKNSDGRLFTFFLLTGVFPVYFPNCRSAARSACWPKLTKLWDQTQAMGSSGQQGTGGRSRELEEPLCVSPMGRANLRGSPEQPYHIRCLSLQPDRRINYQSCGAVHHSSYYFLLCRWGRGKFSSF